MNAADDPYDLEGLGSFTVIDTEGQRIDGVTVDIGPGEELAGRLLPGDRRSGTIWFPVPRETEPRELRFEPLGGEEAVVRWRVPS